MLVQVDFLAAVVLYDGERFGVEPLHEVGGDALGRVAVDHRFREVLAEFFLEGLDVHDFHAARERLAKLCHELGEVLGRDIELLQQVHADNFAVRFEPEGEGAHV